MRVVSVVMLLITAMILGTLLPVAAAAGVAGEVPETTSADSVVAATRSLASTWTNTGPAGAPKARWAYGLAYDPDIKKTVLFGGNATGTTFPADTWTYDMAGNKWTDVSPTVSPPGRCHPAMAYDAKSKKHVLFGGRDNRFAILGDTWVYDAVANTWTNPNPTPAPPPTYHPAMAADPESGKVVFFGGCVRGVGTLACDQLSSQTWVYDPSANTWTDMKPAKVPPPRDRHHMAYDPVAKRALLFGGVGVGSKVDMADTWIYDLANNSWEEIMPATVPPGRDMNPMTFDETRRMIIMFGGYSSFRDTWYFDMSKKNWVKETPTGAPSGRFGHLISYDAGARKSLVFGGWAGSCCVGDTWVYDSGTTIPIPPKVASTSPANAAINVDVKSNVVVTFDLDMDPATTTAAYSISPAVTGGSGSVSGKVLTWTHSANMADSTLYQVNVAKSAKSVAGDEMTAAHSMSFTTAAGNVSIPPKVASTDPANSATGVPIAKQVKVVFDKKMDPTTTQAAFSLSPTVAGTFSWDATGSSMSFTGSAAFGYDTLHTATVAGTAKADDGAALGTPYLFTFRTVAKVDDTPPAIVHTPVLKADELALVTITASITDDTSVSQARVFYRAPGGAWKEVAMSSGLARKHGCHVEVSVECLPLSMAYATDAEIAVYEAVLPNGDIRPPTVDYYIEAEDSAGNKVTHPAVVGAQSPHVITVKKKDTGGGGGGGGGGNNTTGGNPPQTGGSLVGFLTSPMGLMLLIGIIAAIAAAATIVMIARRRKRPPMGAPGTWPGDQQQAQGGYGQTPTPFGDQQQGWNP